MSRSTHCCPSIPRSIEQVARRTTWRQSGSIPTRQRWRPARSIHSAARSPKAIFANDLKGHLAFIAWARSLPEATIGIEGSSSYGAPLARAVQREARERDTPEVTPEVARHYLSNPSQLWNDTEPEGRRAIAEATFDRIEAIGLDLVVYPSAEAESYGRSEAFGPEPLVCSIGQSGRGERTGADTLRVKVRIGEMLARLAVRRSA